MGRTGKELFTGPNTPMCHSFLFTLRIGNFFSIIFFLSGVVWYKYSHPRLFIFFTFTLLIISYGFTLSLSKHGFQNYFYRWLLFDTWFPTTTHFSVRINQNGYLIAGIFMLLVDLLQILGIERIFVFQNWEKWDRRESHGKQMTSFYVNNG